MSHVLAWKNIGFVSLLIYKRRCWVVGAISTPDISQDDRQTSLHPITIVMKTLESRALLVVVAVAVAVANARSIHREKYHGQEGEEKAAAYICTITEKHNVFENGRLVTTEETHETKLCPEHITQKFGNRDTFTHLHLQWSGFEISHDS